MEKDKKEKCISKVESVVDSTLIVYSILNIISLPIIIITYVLCEVCTTQSLLQNKVSTYVEYIGDFLFKLIDSTYGSIIICGWVGIVYLLTYLVISRYDRTKSYFKNRDSLKKKVIIAIEILTVLLGIGVSIWQKRWI